MSLNNFAAAAAVIAAISTPAFSANLVQNGGFEQTTGRGQIDSIVTATGWSQSNSSNFNFVLDTSADDATSGFNGGFTSMNSASANTNIFVWGPGNGSANGFTGSSDGGNFLGGDGGYATGPVQQQISNLTAGNEYKLRFEWAGAQFTDQVGSYWVGWDVSFGSETASVGGAGAGAAAGKGFKPWESAEMLFTASSASQMLSFLATGPAGLPPFSLLDGVSLAENSPTPPVPEPATLGLMLMGGLTLAAVLRRRSAGKR